MYKTYNVTTKQNKQTKSTGVTLTQVVLKQKKFLLQQLKLNFAAKKNIFGAEKIKFCSRKNTLVASGEFRRKKKNLTNKNFSLMADIFLK